MSNIIELAQASVKANDEYEQAMRLHLRSFNPLDLDQFWGAVADLAKNMEHRSVEMSIHNWFCAFVYHSYGKHGVEGWPEDEMTSWEHAARFLARYEQVKVALAKKMNAMPNLGRSDDGYGDLMDSLPLAGEEVCTAIMEDDIANNKQLEAAFEDHPLKDFILHGENYVELKFMEKLRESFLSIADREPSGTIPPATVVLPQLLKAVQLVLAIDASPDENNPETIKLCPSSRKQLRAAVAAAGEEPIDLKIQTSEG